MFSRSAHALHIHAETKEHKTSCTAFVSGEGVSEGELSMTEAFYYNTIRFNFLEGGCRISTQSDYPPPPILPLSTVGSRRGMNLKRLTRTVHVMEVKDGVFLLAIISSDRTVYKWTLLM